MQSLDNNSYVACERAGQRDEAREGVAEEEEEGERGVWLYMCKMNWCTISVMGDQKHLCVYLTVRRKIAEIRLSFNVHYPIPPSNHIHTHTTAMSTNIWYYLQNEAENKIKWKSVNEIQQVYSALVHFIRAMYVGA